MSMTMSPSDSFFSMLSTTPSPPPRPSSPLPHSSTLPYNPRCTFVANPEESNIYLFEADNNHNSNPVIFENSQLFGKHLTTTAKPRFRIVSISSPNSISPLAITESSFHLLLDVYKIEPFFLDLANHFGGKPTSADAGRGLMRIRPRLDGCIDTQFLLTYPEYEPNKANGPGWTLRQVAVFQRLDPANSENLWIVLSARFNSLLQQAIEQFAQTHAAHYDCLVDWCMLPEAILTTYVRNWRPYIANLGEEIEATRKLVHMLPLYDSYDEKIRRRSVIEPLTLADDIASLAVRLTGTLQTVQQLSHVHQLLHHPKSGVAPRLESPPFADELSSHEADLTGNLQGVRILETELQAITNSLSVAVNLKINSQMLKLGTESFDDSSTVKSMTLVALIYLPASFVSSILGMNLFDFDGGEKGSFTISKQFWIFVVLAVPLTLLTLASWYVVARRTRKARERETKQQGDSGAH